MPSEIATVLYRADDRQTWLDRAAKREHGVKRLQQRVDAAQSLGGLVGTNHPPRRVADDDGILRLVEDRRGKDLRGHDLLIPLLLGQIGNHHRGLSQPVGGEKSGSQMDLRAGGRIDHHRIHVPATNGLQGFPRFAELLSKFLDFRFEFARPSLSGFAWPRRFEGVEDVETDDDVFSLQRLGRLSAPLVHLILAR